MMSVKVTVIVFLAGILGLCYWHYSSAYQEMVVDHLRTGKVEGQYVGKDFTRVRQGNFTSYDVKYSYVVNGVTYTKSGNTAINPNLPINPDVYYQPSNPDFASMNAPVWDMSDLDGTKYVTVAVTLATIAALFTPKRYYS